MKTVAEITMDFVKAKQQAEELESIARQLNNTVNELNDCMSSIQSNWTGDNATAYLAKCGQLREKIKKSADRVSKAASTVKTIAATTYAAEMAAVAIVEN